MSLFNLPNVITKDDLLPFDLFPVADTEKATALIPMQNLEASKDIINLMLRNIGWKGYAYKDVDNITKIGYNLTDGIDSLGLTENEAYSKWIKQFKDAERQFKQVFVLDSLSQSQYDGMLSMFYFTKYWTEVGTDDRKFSLYEHVKNREWEYVATAMTNSGSNRIQRQLEAKVIMLADYGIPKDRSLIKKQGIEELANRYPQRMLDDRSKAQAEYVYYAETKRFLPNMSESRQRILSSQLNR